MGWWTLARAHLPRLRMDVACTTWRKGTWNNSLRKGGPAWPVPSDLARWSLPSPVPHCCCLPSSPMNTSITSTQNHPYGLLRDKFQIPTSCLTACPKPASSWFILLLLTKQNSKLVLTKLIGRNASYEYTLFIQYKRRLWVIHGIPVWNVEFTGCPSLDFLSHLAFCQGLSPLSKPLLCGWEGLPFFSVSSHSL